jgi:carbon-monoxide dehydrogenase medium subunit
LIPAQFDYLRADSVEEAVGLLAEHGEEAKLLAGGHSLLPLMKLRLATPARLVDIGRLAELCYVREDGGSLAIGALTTHDQASRSELIRNKLPCLGHVAGQIGDPQVRHRGTLGGSVAHGDAASDLPALFVALDASFVVAGPGGRREIPAAEFHRGFLETALSPDELLVELRVPLGDGAGGFGFEKLTKRAQDWAIVGAVAVRDETGASVGLINMASTPVRARGVERALAEGASLEEAAELADEGTDPSSDLNASSEFRRHLARVLVRRALEKALS